MPVIPWSNMLSVGVRDIDGQHRVLVDILNRLGDVVHSGAADWDGGQVLGELVQYAATHFGFEEDLMRRSGYPEQAAHEQQHRELLRQVQEMVARHGSGEQPPPEALMLFLRDWLTAHIMGADRALGQALNAQGVR